MLHVIVFIQEEKETIGIFTFSSGGERDCGICTNVIVFLQEEKMTIGICTNFIVFIQEENETVDM